MPESTIAIVAAPALANGEPQYQSISVALGHFCGLLTVLVTLLFGVIA